MDLLINKLNFQEIWTWVIPTPHLISDYKIYFRAFDTLVWILIIISTIAVTLLLYLTNKMIKQNLRLNKFNSFSETLLSVFSVLINQPFFTVRPHSTTIRIILTAWLLCSLNFSSIYSSKIVSYLTDSIYEEKLMSLDDLLNSGLSFGLTRESRQFFDRELTDTDSIRIFNNSIRCFGLYKCLNRTATRRDLATAISRSYFNYIKVNFRDEDGNYLIVPMDINIVYTPIEFLFQKNFAMKHRINGLMRSIFESGLINYWQGKLNRNTFIEENKKKLTVQNRRNLNLTVLKDVFKFLKFGWLASLLLLIGEIFVFWIKRKFIFKKDRNLVRTKKLRKIRKRKEFVGRNVYKRQKEWIAFSNKFE